MKLIEFFKRIVKEERETYESIFGHDLNILINIISDQVDEPIEFLKLKIKELKDIQKQKNIILYRVIYVDDPKKINKNKIGKHFVFSTEAFHEEMLDYLFNNARKINSNITEDDLYLIEVETATDNIDYHETMRTFVLHPWEDEITMKDDRNINIKNISKFYE